MRPHCVLVTHSESRSHLKVGDSLSTNDFRTLLFYTCSDYQL
jgi:hypothetical protein